MCFLYILFVFFFFSVDGKKVSGCQDFDLCFGGRRQFCKTGYADLGKLVKTGWLLNSNHALVGNAL